MIVKLGFSPEQFFDNEGRPLSAGRITLTAHDSDVPLTVYSRQGDEYVQAANPIIVGDDGRIDTVFFDATVIDVRIEKRLPNGQYESLDTYQYGMDVPSEHDATEVNGIEALRNADTDLGVVYVTGYSSSYDAPRRMYIWDANCVAQADDGCIIDSSSGATGRWILLWDDEKLPCTIYGIKPGEDESNINAFLNYQRVVGTYSIVLPPIPRFIKGDYSTTASLLTSKTLYFDSGAKFNTQINCYSAIVEPSDSYTADFVFTKQEVACASWFRTARRFLTCGASILRYGLSDYMVDRAITMPVTIANTTIEGNRRLQLTYASGAYLTLNNCTVVGGGVFSPSSDYIRFQRMSWEQSWWLNSNVNQYDFGYVAEGHRLQYTGLDSDDMRLYKFPVTEIYIKMREFNEDHTVTPNRKLYLEGRTLSSINSSAWSEIHDVDITGSAILQGHSSTGYISLYNVRCQNLTLKSSAWIYDNSDLKFTSEPVNCGYIYAYKSTIDNNNLWWNTDRTLSFEECHVKVSLNFANDNTTPCTGVSFVKCFVHDSFLYYKNLNIYDSMCVSCRIRVYPYYDSTAQKYYVKFVAVGNTFNSGEEIRIDMVDDPYDTVNNCYANVYIANNFFMGNQLGLWMRFYANATNWSQFIAPGDGMAGFVYRGNTGLCPYETIMETFSSVYIEDSMFDTELPDVHFYVSYNAQRIVPRTSTRQVHKGWYFQGAMKMAYYDDDIMSHDEPQDGPKYGQLVRTCETVSGVQDNDFFSFKYYSNESLGNTVVFFA